MGLNVIPVNDEPDGLFPGRSPEPKEDTLQGTLDFLRQHNADLAICFDGDADRVVFCDKEGFLGFNEPIAFISRLAVRKTGKKKIATTVETGDSSRPGGERPWSGSSQRQSRRCRRGSPGPSSSMLR